MAFDPPFLERGFRPFFLMAAVYAVLGIVLWVAFYAAGYTPPEFWPQPLDWHAHEMIYGFTLAVIAGFLLTAVANWTGGAPVRHLHLLALVLVWLSGRIVANLSVPLPDSAVIAIQCSFIPVLAISLAIPLFKSRNVRNFVFLGLLAMLSSFEILFFMQEDKRFLYGALTAVLMMISLVGGRVIPSFTVAAMRLRGEKIFQTDQRLLDVLAVLSLLPVGFFLAVMPQTPWLAVAALASAVLHLLRLRRYYFFKSFCEPMLWILHLGYVWLVLGLGLLVCVGLGLFAREMVVHAFTAGCIGSMCIGMMSRVTLGHSGRIIKAAAPVVIAFFLMQAAAVSRVFIPILLPDFYMTGVMLSGAFWALAFILFLAVYAPVYFQPNAPQIKRP